MGLINLQGSYWGCNIERKFRGSQEVLGKFSDIDANQPEHTRKQEKAKGIP